EIADAHREVALDLEIHLGAAAPGSAESEVEEAAVSRCVAHVHLRRSNRAARESENRGDGRRVARPYGRLLAEAAASRRCELVIARAAVVLGGAPLGAEPTAAFHPLEGLVESVVVDAEGAVGPVLEPSGDGVAVHGAPAQGLEDEQVEGALEQWEAVVHSHSTFPVSSKVKTNVWRRGRRVKPRGAEPGPALRSGHAGRRLRCGRVGRLTLGA